MYRALPLQDFQAILPVAVLNEVAIESYGKRANHIGPATTISLADKVLLSLLKALILTSKDEANRTTANLLARSAAAHILHTQTIYADSEPALAHPACLSRRQVCRIQEYIQSNLTRNIPIRELAGLICVSRTQFARRFKATAGMTPHHFIIERRVQHAAALLAGSSLSFAEVRARTGFVNPSHFSATFRRFLKVSPSTYRARTSFQPERPEKPR